jgi:hypothetical protein
MHALGDRVALISSRLVCASICKGVPALLYINTTTRKPDIITHQVKASPETSAEIAGDMCSTCSVLYVRASTTWHVVSCLRGEKPVTIRVRKGRCSPVSSMILKSDKVVTPPWNVWYCGPIMSLLVTRYSPVTSEILGFEKVATQPRQVRLMCMRSWERRSKRHLFSYLVKAAGVQWNLQVSWKRPHLKDTN